MDKFQLISFLVDFIVVFKNLIVYAIIGRIIISWFTMGQTASGGRVTQLLHSATDPFLNLAKKLPHRIGMIDLSPMIALIGIDLIGHFIVVGLSNLV